MKIGLYFGSFNPIHNGHLIIAEHVLNFYTKEVWFIISPQNPEKKNESLLKVKNRLLLVRKAIKKNNRFKISDIELHLPVPSYTINTLNILKDAYKEHDFYSIVGSDNFLSISKWKSAEILLSNFKFLVYERPGFIITETNYNQNVMILKAPLINISSTELRDLIKLKKSIKYLVPEKVAKTISKKSFYI